MIQVKLSRAKENMRQGENSSLVFLNSPKAYVICRRLRCLDKTVLTGTHNLYFYGRIKMILSVICVLPESCLSLKKGGRGQVL